MANLMYLLVSFVCMIVLIILLTEQMPWKDTTKIGFISLIFFISAYRMIMIRSFLIAKKVI